MAILASPTRRAVLQLGAAAGLGASLAGCGLLKSLAAFNYRFSLTISLNGRRVTGSAVQRFLWNGRSYASTGKMLAYTRGEGAVVDLSDRGVVVSTSEPLRKTSRPVASILANALLPPKPDEQDEFEWWLGLLKISASRPVSVPLEDLPLLLWFPDRATPSSVIAIDALEPRPGEPGVLGAELAVTSEPLTDGGVAAALPWFADYHARGLALSGQGGVAVTGDDVASRMHSWSLKNDR